MMEENNGRHFAGLAFPWGWDPDLVGAEFDYALGWIPEVEVGVPILAFDEKERKPVDDNTDSHFGRR